MKIVPRWRWYSNLPHLMVLMIAVACRNSGARPDAADGASDDPDTFASSSPDGPLPDGPASQCASPGALANAQWVKTNGPVDGHILDLYAYQDGILARTWDSLHGGRLFLSNDDGVSWTLSSAAESDIDILSLVLLGDKSLLAATWGHSCRSLSGGKPWDEVTRSGLPEDAAIRSMAVIDSMVFAGTTGNVYRSADNGNTWAEVNPGIPSMATVFSIAGMGKAIFAGTDNSGVFVTRNGEMTWAAANLGLTDLHISQLVVVGPRVLALTSHGVFVSDDGGASWIPDGATTLGVNRYVVMDGKLLAGTEAHGVYVSSDNGDSWSLLGFGWPASTRVWSLAVTGSSIFAGTDSGVWRAGCP